jgi:hypothetical protein
MIPGKEKPEKVEIASVKIPALRLDGGGRLTKIAALEAR